MELVRARPDVLIAGFGTLTAQAAKAATTTIPIVFTTVGDPVGAGVVASLARPGGNATGLSGLTEIGGKRLELLQELIPGKKVVAVLMNPDTPFTRLAVKEVTTAAEAERIRLEVLGARTPDQVSGRFETAIKAGAGGLLVLEDPLLDDAPPTDLRSRGEVSPPCGLHVPGLRSGRRVDVVRHGPTAMFRRAADYVDKILERRQAGRPSGRAADQVRAGDQPQDRQGPRPHDPAVAAGAGGSGDRVVDHRGFLLTSMTSRATAQRQVTSADTTFRGVGVSALGGFPSSAGRGTRSLLHGMACSIAHPAHHRSDPGLGGRCCLLGDVSHR